MIVYCRRLIELNQASSNLIRMAIESLAISILFVVAPSLMFEGVEVEGGWATAARLWILISITGAAGWSGVRSIGRTKRYVIAQSLVAWFVFFLPCLALGYIQDTVSPPTGEPGVPAFLVYAAGMVVFCPVFLLIALSIDLPDDTSAGKTK